MKQEYGYAHKKSFWNKQEYNFSNMQENIEMIIYSLVGFFIPFFIGHPQILVGIIVNSALVLAGLNLKGYKLLPVVLLPSLGVLTRGIMFGALTHYLVIMMPFIWIGNLILVYAFKKFSVHKKMNKWLTLSIGAGLKTFLLFSVAFVFVKFGMLPVLFLTTMGLFQLYTAVAGGVVAIGMHEAKKRLAKV